MSLKYFVMNTGHAAAIGVQGTLRAVSGVTILDSLVAYGDIASGTMVSGDTTFRLTATSVLKLATLELRDASGRTWTRQLHLGFPDAPGTPSVQTVLPEVAGAIDLLWPEPLAPDVLGYNVYRTTAGSPDYTRLNSAVILRSAFCHDPAVNPESTYVYRVAAVDSSGNEGPRSGPATATAPPQYLGTWPRTLEGVIWSSPLCIDINEDSSGDLEVMLGCEDGYLYVFNPDGTPRTGWPKFLGGEIWSSPAVGNLDGDPQMEIVIGSDNRRLYAFNHNGTGLTQTSGVIDSLPGQVRSTPALSDLDQNGDLEIVVGCADGKLYAYDGDGTPYLATRVLGTLGGTVRASPTIADLDGNGDLEVMCCNLQGKVYVFNHDGTPYHTPTGLFFSGTLGMWSSIAVGDADADGQMDVFGATWDQDAPPVPARVYRWNHLGGLMPGWPRTLTEGETWGSPALGDLNDDGKLECVIGSSDRKMHAFQWDGNELPGWPFSAQDSIWSSAALADISGDGRPDVVFTSMDSRIYAVKHDGTPVPGWPLLFTERCYGSGPTVADIDRDGGVDVVGTSSEGRVYVWDVGKPWNPSPSASPWPTFRHDAFRTGWYNRGTTGVEGGPVAAAPHRTELHQNSPNPFNPRTIITYSLAAEGELTLSVFDVAGRRVKTLVTGAQPAGHYRVIWDGTDDQGHESASGVYFYRLETRADTFNRKMILVR